MLPSTRTPSPPYTCRSAKSAVTASTQNPTTSSLKTTLSSTATPPPTTSSAPFTGTSSTLRSCTKTNAGSLRRFRHWQRPLRKNSTTRASRWTSAFCSTLTPTDHLRLLAWDGYVVSYFLACAGSFAVGCTISRLASSWFSACADSFAVSCTVS